MVDLGPPGGREVPRGTSARTIRPVPTTGPAPPSGRCMVKPGRSRKGRGMAVKSLALLAFDLGAESGRAFAGRLEGEKLVMTGVHRFANEPVLLPDGLHWDFLRLCHEIETGLAKAGREHGNAFDGIAVEIRVMKRLKEALDPRGILNPRKIFPE